LHAAQRGVGRDRSAERLLNGGSSRQSDQLDSIVHADAIHGDVIRVGSLSGGAELPGFDARAGRSDEDSGSDLQQRQQAASAQRKRVDQIAPDDGADGAILSVEQILAGRDLDGILPHPGAECEIDAGSFADVQLHPHADGGLKSAAADADFINAGLRGGNRVVAFPV
jgi:hypothetical protein